MPSLWNDPDCSLYDQRGWFGIHIGDGKCVELLENGTLCEPIPWDEACEQNITTSICDSDAIEEFRYVIQKDFPAAIFIGSDGIDDSYSSEMELHELYRNIFIVFAEHSTEVGNNEVRDYLPKITRRGSGDDVSIAALFARIFLKVQLLKLGCAAKKSG